MAATVLPFVGSIQSYRITTTIGSSKYQFDVRWSDRDSAWYFDLSDAAGAPIIKGSKITLGAYIGRLGATVPPLRDGILVALDLSRSGQEATFDDLGTRVQVRYVPIEDFIARLNTSTD
jgi:hypothetical protein